MFPIMSTVLALEQCLLVASTAREEACTQSEVYMWAIFEGFSRTTWGRNWHDETADHSLCCINGCTIRAGDTFFMFGDHNKTAGIPFCVPCVAKMLYAERVWDLPPVRHCGWSQAQARPLSVKEC